MKPYNKRKAAHDADNKKLDDYLKEDKEKLEMVEKLTFEKIKEATVKKSQKPVLRLRH